MSDFKKGDRVRKVDSSRPMGTVIELTRIGTACVRWDGPAKVTAWYEPGELVHATPAPFKRGDKVEHIDNAPGFTMTVAADQFTSGAVLVEWADGSRHDHEAKFLKHAGPLPTIQTPSIDIGSDWAKADDVVSAPSHYRAHPSGIEVIDITKHESFLRGNVLKYVLRAPYKNNELEDMRKAQQYLAWEIERLEGENND